MRQTESIYLVTLQKETISPFAKENDEEKVTGDTGKVAMDKGAADKAAGKTGGDKGGLTIDWDGIQNRIVDLPIRAGDFMDLTVGKDDAVYYIDNTNGEGGALHKYDLKKRKDQEITDLNWYLLSADKKENAVFKGRQLVGWSMRARSRSRVKGPVPIGDIQVKVDPAAEWADIFDGEAWRVSRDYFYDPNMHGVDWLWPSKRSTPLFLSRRLLPRRPEPTDTVDGKRIIDRASFHPERR